MPSPECHCHNSQRRRGQSGTRMAENVLYADLNLPEPTRPRILTLPDLQGCTYAELKVKAQDTNAASNCKSSGKSRCSRKHVAILVVVILVLVLAVYLIITYGFACFFPSKLRKFEKFPQPITLKSQSLPPAQRGTWGRHGKAFDPWNLKNRAGGDGPTAGSQQVSTTNNPEEALLGCPPAWKKHGRKCYFFSPERKQKHWDAFRAECSAMGSDLVVIDSREELRYLLSQSRDKYYLLGLTYSPEEQQKWKWINNVEHDPAMFSIMGRYQDYLCTVIGFGEVRSTSCGGDTTTQNMCEKAATIS
ncbi:C-type lectin domain family 5 member A-like isoform X3 [Haemorhous mexicanus]|uniref:C-type lectin domain family 5 member A-like isoform X3 n=1 Tax=Haemorhous mexicanus TaxID=30427 RepID=UPI0028BF25B5|nr:C-type lectin domain family 5 member A-like isoform X3 [Haemorhous mexicanus]